MRAEFDDAQEEVEKVERRAREAEERVCLLLQKAKVIEPRRSRSV